MTDQATPGRSADAGRAARSSGGWTPDAVSNRPHYTPPAPRGGTSTRGSSDRASSGAGALPRLDPTDRDRDRRSSDRSTTRSGAGTHGHERPWRSLTHHQPTAARTERGLAGWQGLLVLLVIAGIGGLIDLVSGTAVRGGFNYGIILASLVAILAVRRSAMFPVVVAPPIVYFVASAVLLLVRSHGLSDRGAAIDVAINWLVYGFPAIAAASAVVLIIAGVRLIVNR